MSKTYNKSNPLSKIEFVQDISPESAAAVSGGAITPTDVSLYSESSGGQYKFGSNKAIKNLADYGFNDTTAFIAVNNDRTWRFYEDADFKGHYIDVGPDEASLAGDFGMTISSFKSIT